MKKNLPTNQTNFLFYTGNDGKVNVEVFLKDETVWLTQKALAELFCAERSVITKHLGNIFKDGELVENSVCAIIAHTASDGKKYKTKFYNLDAIISVGYRVNSYQATQFRIWATKTLKEFIIKGFVLDDERLKQGNQVFGKDYFHEQVEFLGNIARLYRGKKPENLHGSADMMAEKFPDGAYRDIPGLCKMATIKEIKAQGWSLNPGWYVGVAEREEDDFDFYERLEELNEELAVLNGEARELESRIAENVGKLLETR